MKWEYFSKRRRISLSEYLKDVKTIEEAVHLFERETMELPEDKQLEALFSERLDIETLLSEKLSRLAADIEYINISVITEPPLPKPNHPPNKVEKDAKKHSKKGG